MTFEEKTISTEYIYKGKVITLRKDKVTVPNGTSYREVIEHGGGAVIIAITDENKMVMVRQYRKPANRVVFEAPAGKIDPGEDPLETAKRELKEETGYTASDIKYVTEFYPSVGYDEEILYLYFATGLTPGETDFDENEELDIEEWNLDELYRMVMNAEIKDGKTIIAILMAKEILAKGETL